MLKPKLIFTSVLLTIPLLLLFSSKKVLATTLFQDNFEQQSSNNWNRVVNPGAWSIQNIQGSYRFGSSNPGIETEADAGNYSWGNYEFSVDMLPTSGTDRNLLFRVTNQRITSSNLNLPVAYGIHMYSTHIWLQKFTSNEITEPVNVNADIPDNQITNIKIRLIDNNIKVYLGNDINPTIDWTDTNNPILHGEIGLLITGNSSVWFDNVLVTDLTAPTPSPTPIPTPTPTPLPNLNVPDIKQYSLPWGPLTYDHADTWSSSPTIASWGCALTSADMILQYYGFPVTPGSLNTWLNSQLDGYIGNGLINWLAVSRYSKTHAITQPSLEFRRLSNTNANLLNELKNTRPAILEEPGHFIVAKSQTTNSFGINDPAYGSRSTLLSYNNTFNSIESYIPSHTDLSYIMLTIDPQFNLQVFDTNNNEITGNTFTQNPLVDDANNTGTSGSPLETFMFPKPANGNYRVEVSGPIGNYELDSYLYDINGNPIVNKIKGIMNTNETDEFQITIGQTNLITQKLTINDLAADWSGTQNNITAMFTNAATLISNNQNKPAKVLLGNAIKFIKFYTPNSINIDTSQILQNETQSLINSL